MRRLPFDIIYEDRDVIVVDKPSGMLTTPTNAMRREVRASQPVVENFLRDYIRKGQQKSRAQAWLVHRLDRGTSGVLLFAKSQALADSLRDNWHAISEKTYVARVEGVMEGDSGVFESYLRENPRSMRVYSVPEGRGGKFARTRWRKISSDGRTTTVEALIDTGRKNQIRVHFSDAGHPVVGDVKYGAAKAARLCLHAWRLAIDLPSGRKIFTSPIPDLP